MASSDKLVANDHPGWGGRWVSDYWSVVIGVDLTGPVLAAPDGIPISGLADIGSALDDSCREMCRVKT